MANTGKVNGTDDSFILNDIELNIPPTDIYITKNSVNNQWQTLRTKNSQKTKSGHSSIDVEFTVAFVGFDDINQKLRPLIAQLRYMPFCFADNSFLRQNIFPQETEEAGSINSKSTLTLAIRAISISVQANTPNTIWATFQFSYFNYSPYTPLWQYKKDLFGIDAQKYVSNPLNSLAWKKFVAPSINETSLYDGIESSATIKFLELRTAPISDVVSLEQSRSILTQLQSNPKEFFKTLRTEVLNSPEETLRNAVAKNLSGFNNLNSIASSDLILPLVIDASPRSNPSSTSFDRTGNFINQDTLKQAMAQLDDRINAKIKASNQIENTISDGFELINNLVGQDNRGSSFGVFKKIREVSLTPSDGIIITGITVSIQNILATIPILGQRYATFQHIGSIDATATFDIKAISDEGMKNLSWFYDTVNENMLSNRHIPQGMQTIRVKNNFLGLFNLKEFVTNDMHIDTIPGSPGTYDIKLSLIESGLKSNSSVDNASEQFKSEFGSSDPSLTKEVVNVLIKNIKSVLVAGNQQFISAVTDPRSSRLDSLVTKFAGDVSTATNVASKLLAPVSARVRNLISSLSGNQQLASSIDQTSSLNKFCNDVFSIVKTNPLLLNSLFSLTENDVPGITKVQENIADRFKSGVSGLDAISKSFSDKSLQDIVDDAKKNASTKDSILKLKARQDLANLLNGQDTTPDKPKNNSSFLDQILTGGILLRSSTVGTVGSALINPADLTTIESTATVENLVAMTPFIRWNEFISNLSRDITESEDVNLPEFSQVKSMIHHTGLSRGLPAYADFQFERLVNDDIDKLLSLDPDCFLFSKIDSSIDDFIDPALIANAKLIANNSYNTAIDQVSKYYKDSWLPNALSTNIRNKVIANIQSGVSLHGSEAVAAAGDDVDKAYYRGNIKVGDYYNATSQLGNRPIEVGASTIDASQIHSSFSSKTILTSSGTPILHSMDPGKLTEAQQSGNALILPSSKQPGTPEPNSKGSDFAGGRQIFKPIDGELKIAGPTGDFHSARQLAEFGANDVRKMFVATHGRLHGGVDLKADLGSNVYAVADGTITKMGWDRQSPKGTAAGFAIIIQHIDNTKSYYFHLIEEQLSGLRVGVRVKGGQLIGHIGRTAVGDKNTPTHLHMEFHDPVGIGLNPGNYLSITAFNGKKNIAVANYGPKNGPGNGVTAGSTVMDAAIQNFHASLRNGQGLRLVRAFPAFKLYFIQDDSGNRRRFGADDFFSYNAVVDITCVRSRKIPADLLEITLTNVSGILSNRKFQGPRDVTNESPEGVDNSISAVDAVGNATAQDPNAFSKRDSKFENPLASLMIQPGIDVELMLGYSNDPDKLTAVFVGKIMEVEFSESDDLVRIIAQSHAIELVQDIKGMDKPIEKSGWFINDARTDRILESMMSEPEVIHFGRWIRSKTITEGNSNRELLTNKFSLNPSPQDDNIFVPPIEKLNELDNGWFFKNLQYSIFRTTIWDIFEEMTLRHPGWIKSAVPYKGKYGPRMTMFFGLPSQLYFAADPTVAEKQSFNSVVNNYKSLNDKLRDTTSGFNPNSLDKNPNNNLQSKPIDKDFLAERLQLAKDYQSIKPFRAYHLLTSKNHIISNNIRASAKGTFNTISVQYGQGKFNKDTQSLIQSDYDILTLSIDAALPDEDIREMFVQYNNCQHKLLAKKYAVALLMKQLKEVYKGELTIIGNPDIKPYDICLAPWSEIYTPQGWKRIDTLNINDEVYSHTGIVRKIKQTMNRIPTEDILKIKPFGSSEFITATANHPFFTVSAKDIRDKEKPWKGINRTNLFPGFRAAKNLEVGDYLLTPIPKFEQNISKDLCRLLGYYLAEGNIIYEYRKTSNIGKKLNKQNTNPMKNIKVPVAVQWTFHEKETNLADELDIALVNLGLNKVNRYFNSKRHSLTCIIYNRDLTNKMISMGGVGSHTKELLIKPNKEECLNLIGAYFNGDGHQIISNLKQKGTLRSTSVSKNLIRSLYIALASVGIVSRFDHRITQTAFSSNKKQDIYILAISNKEANKLIPYTKWESFESKSNNNRSWIWNNYIVSPIVSIEKDLTLDKVYNIAVEEDESYICETTAVHNCYLFDDYSDLMGPIEVEQVAHRFSQDTGFITEITPDLFVVANEWVNMTATDLMSVIIEGTTSTFTNGAPSFIEGVGPGAKGALVAGGIGLALISPLAAIVAGGLAVGGYFMLKKMVDFTSHGQPVVIHPLIHRGVPFVAGLPMAKLNNLWDINKGQWFKEGFEGISFALEDFNDKLTLAPSQGSIFNLFSGNTIPPKF